MSLKQFHSFEYDTETRYWTTHFVVVKYDFLQKRPICGQPNKFRTKQNVHYECTHQRKHVLTTSLLAFFFQSCVCKVWMFGLLNECLGWLAMVYGDSLVATNSRGSNQSYYFTFPSMLHTNFKFLPFAAKSSRHVVSKMSLILVSCHLVWVCVGQTSYMSGSQLEH